VGLAEARLRERAQRRKARRPAEPAEPREETVQRLEETAEAQPVEVGIIPLQGRRRPGNTRSRRSPV